jgi:hypothetical protein
VVSRLPPSVPSRLCPNTRRSLSDGCGAGRIRRGRGGTALARASPDINAPDPGGSLIPPLRAHLSWA